MLGDTVCFSEAYVASYFLRVVSWGKSYGHHAGFERSRCVNGVAVVDCELMLWGMKAMP